MHNSTLNRMSRKEGRTHAAIMLCCEDSFSHSQRPFTDTEFTKEPPNGQVGILRGAVQQPMSCQSHWSYRRGCHCEWVRAISPALPSFTLPSIGLMLPDDPVQWFIALAPL